MLIAGGGIGGLAAAIALSRRGIASHVLERRPAFHEEGAGIQIGPNGTRILERLGVASALRPYVGVSDAICVHDGATGAELAHLPLGPWIEMRHGDPYWVAHRRDLHAALLQTARAEPRIALTMGFAVDEAAASETRVAVAGTEGQAWTGRALIGADGVRSAVRSALFQGPAPRFAGKSAARSVLPMALMRPDYFAHETGIWLFPNAHVVHYPVSAGAELAVVVIVADEHEDEDWSAPVPPVWVEHRLPRCAAPLADMIATARTWKKWALQTMPSPPAWAHGPVALLGDAAHPVLPFLAQGGVLALEDAVVLAEALYERGNDVARAFKDYQRRRRPRAVRVAQASRRNGRIYHLSGVLAAARDATLRALPGERIMARYDWLYGWRED